MDPQQSINNQTNVSVTLATHLLSKKHNSNVFFSPLSIHVALSLLAEGSKGQTLDQLLAFLKIDTTDELHSLYSKLVPLIFANGNPGDGLQLSFANGVWVDKTLSLKPAFKQVVDTVYKAACNQVDFRTKTAEVASEVNLWAENQTNGLIRGVVPVNAVSSLTRLMFANAVYFKGIWRQQFDPSMTKYSDFYLLNGSKVQVPFMTSKNLKYVCEYDDFKALCLPYLPGNVTRYSMCFFLPNSEDGLQSLVKKIGSTSNFFAHHIPTKLAEVPHFLIPKFKISISFEASDMLKELGLVLPFCMGDDLTEMVDSSVGQGLYVSSIHHKSFVEVNEERTEASASSLYKVLLFPQNPIYDKVDFVADHPFVFVIREDVTGMVLFMGQVIDPRVG